MEHSLLHVYKLEFLFVVDVHSNLTFDMSSHVVKGAEVDGGQ